jgi:hypothetical protein
VAVVKVFVHGGLCLLADALHLIVFMCLFHRFRCCIIHLFLSIGINLGLKLFSLSLKLMNQPLGYSSFLPIEWDFIALFLKTPVVIHGLLESLSSKIHGISIFHGSATNLREKGSARLVLLWQEARV